MTKIFIEGYELDLSEGLTNQITYAIDDLNNLDSKSTAFTKTIVLPGTDNNNKLFGNIFEFNNSNFNNPLADNVFYNFNAAKNAKARIEVNGLQVIKGVMRLLEIIRDGQGIEYECAIFGELGGFINALGNNRLEDLDFSAYNHTYSISNIVSSWDTMGASGYCYPLIDYGNVSTGVYGTAKKDFQYTTFRPALFVREYIDKLITDAGYTYSSNFMDSAFFKRLVLPHNQKDLRKYTSNLFIANRTTPYTILSNSVTGGLLTYETFSGNGFTLNSGNDGIVYTDSAPLDCTFNVYIEGNYYSDLITIDFQILKNGYTIYSNTDWFQDTGGTTPQDFAVDREINLSLVTGDYIQIQFIATGSRPFEVNVTSATSKMFTGVPVSAPITLGSSLVINDTIPRGIFQKDFFTSILKMFNLLVTEDKYITNHLNIEPYIDFWSGDVLDWSDKLDRSQPIRIKPMSEINSRYYNLKYKQDNDFYNEDYRKKFNEGYGDRIYDNGLEFAKDSESVEVIFASSVLYGALGQDKVFPAIYKKSNENTKEDPMDCVVRIMQVNKITGVSSWAIYNGATSLTTNTSYLYGGHFNDPDAPSNDLNFGAPDQLYFTLTTGNITNNLFNVYYSPYMSEITDKDSRLVTGMFKLTDIDMFNLDFSKFIFIDGGVYRISKIVDYTPESNELTKVELLRVINKTY